MSRIFTTSFASVYPHYVTKVEKKARSKAELDQVIEWLTGFDESELSHHLAAGNLCLTATLTRGRRQVSARRSLRSASRFALRGDVRVQHPYVWLPIGAAV